MIPGVPSDNTTLLEVLDELRAKGYEASMWVAPSGNLRCEGCPEEIEPQAVQVHEIRRLEGASDPDDMLAVVAGVCGACGVKATIVIHYGPEASSEEMEAFTHLARAG